ncbi:MAG: signal peptidase I [Kiritimatiellae bacterium]|nr:signal peptidase I [Kiritimatiellia bacterium]
MTLPFTKKRRERKEAKLLVQSAKTYLYSYEDVKDLSGLRAAIDANDLNTMRELLAEYDRPRSFAAGREWLDILVVSISVAMAFRAYFYEPFNIPTGSMQPTLYGNHSEPCTAADATWIDTTPLKWGKWLVTGKMYERFTAPATGELRFVPRNDGYYDMVVVNMAGIREHAAWQKNIWPVRTVQAWFAPKGSPINPATVPTDVLRGSAGDAPVADEIPRLPNGLRPGSIVHKGDELWSGYVVTGDFLFVNRWLWNFRMPKRGDVMVFSTTGIEGLQQGTHYIKRMTGLPGETLEIKDGHLYADGEMPDEPLRVRQIQSCEAYHESEPRYAGYRLPEDARFRDGAKTLQFKGDKAVLGEGEYYACGDNSRNSFDSRYWGPVPAGNLRGVAGGVFWPLSHRWGNVK